MQQGHLPVSLKNDPGEHEINVAELQAAEDEAPATWKGYGKTSSQRLRVHVRAFTKVWK
jgi:hypothetical protein